MTKTCETNKDDCEILNEGRPWKLDLDRYTLTHVATESEVDLDKCDTPEDRLWWIGHYVRSSIPKEDFVDLVEWFSLLFMNKRGKLDVREVIPRNVREEAHYKRYMKKIAPRQWVRIGEWLFEE